MNMKHGLAGNFRSGLQKICLTSLSHRHVEHIIFIGFIGVVFSSMCGAAIVTFRVTESRPSWKNGQPLALRENGREKLCVLAVKIGVFVGVKVGMARSLMW